MTVRFVGGLSATWLAPHIYFIRADAYLYIGETQKHPILRWSQHLAVESSLRQTLDRRGVGELDGVRRLAFYAFEIEALAEQFPRVQIKAATQAVEHELHMLLRARPSLLGLDLQVISDTEKTAPRAFRRWDVAEAIAQDAADALRAALAGASL